MKGMNMMKKICIIGGSGHAMVVADIIECMIRTGEQVELIGFLDDNPLKSRMLSYNRLGSLNQIEELTKSEVNFCIAIGDNRTRKSITEKYKTQWFTPIHPKAIVSPHVQIMEGSVIMPGCIINAGTVIGRHVIINSAAVIEHDCKVSDFVHVSPNATLCGNVRVDESTHIGAGATIIHNIKIGAHSIIGAGAVVVRDVIDGVIVKGIPAK